MKNTFDGQSIRNLTKNAKITYKTNLSQFILDSIVQKVQEEAIKRFGENIEVDCLELAEIYNKKHSDVYPNESLQEDAIREVITVLHNADFIITENENKSLGNIIISWEEVKDEEFDEELDEELDEEEE